MTQAIGVARSFYHGHFEFSLKHTINCEVAARMTNLLMLPSAPLTFTVCRLINSTSLLKAAKWRQLRQNKTEGVQKASVRGQEEKLKNKTKQKKRRKELKRS